MVDEVVLDPFQEIVDVHWASKYFVVVRGYQDSDLVPTEGGGGRFGKFDFDTAVGSPETVWTEEGFEDEPLSYRFLITIDKLPPAGQIAFVIEINGKWETADVPGLPILQSKPSKIAVYLFDGSAHEVDPSNSTYHLRRKDGQPLTPDATTSTEGTPTVVDVGEVDFGYADVRITTSPSLGITLATHS